MLRIIAIAVLLLIVGCRPAPVDEPELRPVDEAERESALELLERARTDVLDQAFAQLARRPHTLRERLHQLDEQGQVNAYRRRTLVHDPPETETVSAESEGTFDFGAFGRFVSFDDLDRLPQNPVPYLLAEDPPYLSPQGREVYHFALEPDTTIRGVTVRVVEVTAIPGEGDDQPVRSARLLIDPRDAQVVGLRVVRRTNNMLFGETSVLEITLVPHGDRSWAPEMTDYRVALRAALTATRRFHLQRQYDVRGSSVAAVVLTAPEA